MFRMRIRDLAVVVSVLALSACGGGSSNLSPAAADGLDVARSNGCTACHGTEGEGGIGPAWQGLMGSQVELADGRTTTADPEYIKRSIQEPEADLVADYTTKMPKTELDADQIDAVIAYIEEISQ